MARVYVAREFPTCIHVTVEDSENKRSAVQLARNEATRYYGMRVSRAVSSGGHYVGNARGKVDYTYVFSAPDLVTDREVWEVITTDGRLWHANGIASRGIFPTPDEAYDNLARVRANLSAGQSAYVRGPVTQYRRPNQ